MRFAILLAFLLTLPGCAAVPHLLKYLPQVVKLASGIAESSDLLTLLDGEAQSVYPAGTPAEFKQALQAARATLHALRAAQLAADNGQGPEVERALHAFRAAFVALRMAASRLGIIKPDGTLAHTRPHTGPSFGGPAVYVFPTPLLLRE